MGHKVEQQSRARSGERIAGGEFGGWLDQLSVLLATLTLIIMILLVIIIALLVMFGGV
jgi:hypothetical protein